MSVTHDAADVGVPRRIDLLLSHYGESHRDPRNERIHFVAIPVIMLSLVGLLYAAHPFAAYGFILASLVYYARLSIPFFLAMAVLSALAVALVRAMGAWVLPLSATLFVAAWIAQFVGHRMEGRKPSFLEDLQYLWVGPIFVLSKLFRRLGVGW